jgi:hypothetical protein
MTVCLETGRATFCRKGRASHLKRPLRPRVSDAATISSYSRATLWHPWFHFTERRGQVGINDGRRARSSERRWRRFLFEGTVDPARTDADELGNLLFVAALPIQFPDPLMHAYSLAMTRTTLLRNLFRYCCPLSRTCFACAALRRLFERALLLAKELLQGFGKVLLYVKTIDHLFGLRSALGGSFPEEFAAIA